MNYKYDEDEYEVLKNDWDEFDWDESSHPNLSFPGDVLNLCNVDRRLFKGSFIIHVYLVIDNNPELIGQKSVLQLWDMSKCGNCQDKSFLMFNFPLDIHLEDKDIKEKIKVLFTYKEEVEKNGHKAIKQSFIELEDLKNEKIPAKENRPILEIKRA